MNADVLVAADSVLVPREELAWQVVAGELVVLDLDSHVLRGVNRTAERVWELLDGKRTLGEVAAAVAARYQAPVEQVLGDVLAFAAQLVAKNLCGLAQTAG